MQLWREYIEKKERYKEIIFFTQNNYVFMQGNGVVSCDWLCVLGIVKRRELMSFA